MAGEDIDLTKTCPSCASPNVSTNRAGQVVCRDCGSIAPAGNVVSIGISKIKSIFSFKKKKAKKSKKKKAGKKKIRKRDRLKKKIKSILSVRKKIKPKPKKGF